MSHCSKRRKWEMISTVAHCAIQQIVNLVLCLSIFLFSLSLPLSLSFSPTHSLVGLIPLVKSSLLTCYKIRLLYSYLSLALSFSSARERERISSKRENKRINCWDIRRRWCTRSYLDCFVPDLLYDFCTYRIVRYIAYVTRHRAITHEHQHDFTLVLLLSHSIISNYITFISSSTQRRRLNPTFHVRLFSSSSSFPLCRSIKHVRHVNIDKSNRSRLYTPSYMSWWAMIWCLVSGKEIKSTLFRHLNFHDNEGHVCQIFVLSRL